MSPERPSGIARRRATALTSPAMHAGAWGDGRLGALLYRRADGIIALAAAERGRLVSLGERISVTGVGPGSSGAGDQARLRARYAVGNRPLVPFAGRRRHRGDHALVEAMGVVTGEHPEACLVSVGPPPE